MKIIYKLMAGFLFVSLQVTVIAYFGLYSANDIGDSYNAVGEETIPVIKALEDMRFVGMKMAGSTHELASMVSGNKTHGHLMEKERRELLAGMELYNESFQRYEVLVNGLFPGEEELLLNISIPGEKLQKIGLELMELSEQGITREQEDEKVEE